MESKEAKKILQTEVGGRGKAQVEFSKSAMKASGVKLTKTLEAWASLLRILGEPLKPVHKCLFPCGPGDVGKSLRLGPKGHYEN